MSIKCASPSSIWMSLISKAGFYCWFIIVCLNCIGAHRGSSWNKEKLSSFKTFFKKEKLSVSCRFHQEYNTNSTRVIRLKVIKIKLTALKHFTKCRSLSGYLDSKLGDFEEDFKHFYWLTFINYCIKLKS